MNHAPLSRAERITYAVVIVVIFGLFAADIATNYEPIKLSALFFVLAGIPLLAIHEVGHALVARGVGWSVQRIVIGFGRTWYSFDVGNVRVEIRSIPVEGFTTTRPLDRRWPRLKGAAIYAAGCAFEVVVAAIIVLAIGIDDFFVRTQSVPIIAGQSVVAFVALSCASNLIPHAAAETSVTDDGIEVSYTPNDGLGIIQSLTGKR